MYVCCFGGCVCVYFIIRYTDINRLASGSSRRIDGKNVYRLAWLLRDDFSFRLLARSRTSSLGSWPVNIFPRAIIAQPCLPTRWRTSLTEIRNHLSRMTAGSTVVVTKDFVSRKGTVTFYFSFNRLTEKRDRSIDFPWIEDMNSTITIGILQRFYLALSSSFVPFLKLSDWL